jgi:hypothetical protein
MTLAVTLSLSLFFVTVLIHYEGLRLASRELRTFTSWQSRNKMLLIILWIFLIHIVEISIYAFTFWFADIFVDIGSFAGARETGMFDYFYFSAESFTTLGLGDIYPIGPVRLLASIEPLNGLILIGWSTSFTFLSMQRYWFSDKRDAGKP